MKTSCIPNPKREPLIIIKKWQISFCKEMGIPPKVGSALLSYYEYWHNWKLDQIDKGLCDPDDLLQYHSQNDLKDGIMEIGGKNSIIKCNEKLEDLGIITIVKVAGNIKKNHFLFKPDIIINWLENDYDISQNSQKVNTKSQKVNTKVEKSKQTITEINKEINKENLKTKVFSNPKDELEYLKLSKQNLELKIKELEKATESSKVNIEVKKELPVKDSSAKKTDAPKKSKKQTVKFPSKKAMTVFDKYWMPLTGSKQCFQWIAKERQQLKNLYNYIFQRNKGKNEEELLKSLDNFLAVTLALNEKFYSENFTPSHLTCNFSKIETKTKQIFNDKTHKQYHKLKAIQSGKPYEPVTTEYTKYLDECKEFFPSASQFKNVLSEEDFKLVKDRKVFEERVYGMYTRWDRMMLYIHWALDAGKINLSGHNGSMIEYMKRIMREYLNHKINDPSASNDEFDKFRINYITDNRVWYKK